MATKRYIAQRSMTVGSRDAMRKVEHGDEVPEAADWPNLSVYVEMGHVLVEDVPTPTKAPKKPAKATKKAKAPVKAKTPKAGTASSKADKAQERTES